MGGIFGVASKEDCVLDLFFGTDYHSHLGTKRGGMAVYGESGFNRAIHNIENSPFRTKFERDVEELCGKMGIGCISDTEPQPCWCSRRSAALPSRRSAASIIWRRLSKPLSAKTGCIFWR